MTPLEHPYDQGIEQDHRNAIRFGWRRRCAWCGVSLRGWQLNMCRLCRGAVRYVTLPGQPPASPPCPHAARWDDKPDDWRWPGRRGKQRWERYSR